MSVYIKGETGCRIFARIFLNVNGTLNHVYQKTQDTLPVILTIFDHC